MWIITGSVSVLMTILNLTQYFRKKPARWFRFSSLALTLVTLCIFYGEVSTWVQANDWSAIQDVVPVMSKVLWVYAGSSVIINGISLFEK